MGRSGLDGDELQEALLTLASQVAAGLSRYLELLADFDEAELYGPWQCRSTAHWLNVRAGVNLRTAQEQLRVARALRCCPWWATPCPGAGSPTARCGPSPASPLRPPS